VLFVLYVFCVDASAVGLFVSTRLLIKKCIDGGHHAPGYNRYLNSLVAYYAVQLAVNLAVALAFIENRCHHHNLDLRVPTSASYYSALVLDPSSAILEQVQNATGGYCTAVNCASYGDDCCAPSMRSGYSEEARCSGGFTPVRLSGVGCHMYDNGMYACCNASHGNSTLPATLTLVVPDDSTTGTGEPNPASHYFARCVYMMLTLGGGVVTNVVLELVLVRKARMVEGVGRCTRCVRSVACAPLRMARSSSMSRCTCASERSVARSSRADSSM
jgi:hypothetical protein